MENAAMEFIEKVREANPIQRVLAAFVPEFGGLKVKGKRKLKLRCPFHEGEDAQFVVYTQEQSYRCFSCDRVGDVFDMVREIKKVDFPGALEQLARMAGISWPKLDQEDWQEELELRALGDILGATVDFYYRSNITSGYCDHLKSSKSGLSVDIVEAKMGLAWRPEPGGSAPRGTARAGMAGRMVRVTTARWSIPESAPEGNITAGTRKARRGVNCENKLGGLSGVKRL